MLAGGGSGGSGGSGVSEQASKRVSESSGAKVRAKVKTQLVKQSKNVVGLGADPQLINFELN